MVNYGKWAMCKADDLLCGQYDNNRIATTAPLTKYESYLFMMS